MNGMAAGDGRHDDDSFGGLHVVEAPDEGVDLDAEDPARESSDAPVDRGPLLAVLRSLGDEVAAIDPRVLETEPERSAVLVRTLEDALGRVLAVLTALQHADDPPPEHDLALDETFDDAPPGPVHRLTLPRLANICFAGAFELSRVRRELVGARDVGDVMVAAETARRKLLRACRAVLEAADDTVDVTAPWRDEAALVRAGLGVRRLYAALRRSLRRATSDDPEAVLTAARYAAGGLAALVGAAAYDDVRASDRALLRQLHQRALAWAKGDRDVTAGLRLLDDVWTCADLLRGINRRQELRAHDATAVRNALGGPGDTPGAWLVGLERLVGLDDALDAAILRANSGGLDDTLAAEIVERLHHLR